MTREPGLSVRARLALSYAALLMVAGSLLFAVVWLFLLRYVPPNATAGPDGFFPGRDDLVRAFAPAATLAFGGLLIVSVLGGWLLAGRMLAPLRRITAATREAAAGSLSHRINMPGKQNEFSELADAFDTMLGRIESHVAEQQRFAANASHELRTPLAITQALIDVAQNDPTRDRAADLARLKETNARAIRLTEALLLLSRAGNTLAEREPVDVTLLAEQAAETLLPLAESRGVAIEVDGTAGDAAGSQPLLLQLVTNIMHNAIVHNRPDGGTVWVTVTNVPHGALLAVENSGMRLDPALVATLTEPFVRGTTRARSASDTGSGLGLSIAERIVHAHGGTLTLTPRAEGGLRVEAFLPRA